MISFLEHGPSYSAHSPIFTLGFHPKSLCSLLCLAVFQIGFVKQEGCVAGSSGLPSYHFGCTSKRRRRRSMGFQFEIKDTLSSKNFLCNSINAARSFAQHIKLSGAT